MIIIHTYCILGQWPKRTIDNSNSNRDCGTINFAQQLSGSTGKIINRKTDDFLNPFSNDKFWIVL